MTCIHFFLRHIEASVGVWGPSYRPEHCFISIILTFHRTVTGFRWFFEICTTEFCYQLIMWRLRGTFRVPRIGDPGSIFVATSSIFVTSSSQLRHTSSHKHANYTTSLHDFARIQTICVQISQHPTGPIKCPTCHFQNKTIPAVPVRFLTCHFARTNPTYP